MKIRVALIGNPNVGKSVIFGILTGKYANVSNYPGTTVEITRGCGRGCKFCSPMMRERYSLPLEHILKEVRINAKNGTRMIILAGEDIFLYKCNKEFLPNREAIVELIKSIASVPGVEFIQPAHAALAPIVFDPKIIEEIGPVLRDRSYWITDGVRHSSVEVGIEPPTGKGEYHEPVHSPSCSCLSL